MEGTNNKTAIEMLDDMIKTTLEDLDIAKFNNEEQKPLLEKLKTLCAQKKELEDSARDCTKIENDTAIRIKELELKEENEKKTREIEEKKVEEQKKSNTVNAIIAGVGALTGIASLVVTVFMFKKGLTFEETGSYTTKTIEKIGSLGRIVKH